jgi:hypothetical protein
VLPCSTLPGVCGRTRVWVTYGRGCRIPRLCDPRCRGAGTGSSEYGSMLGAGFPAMQASALELPPACGPPPGCALLVQGNAM